eukprot:Nk52_evm1s1504 gene=Nk52_evmTU1s1504
MWFFPHAGLFRGANMRTAKWHHIRVWQYESGPMKGCQSLTVETRVTKSTKPLEPNGFNVTRHKHPEFCPISKLAMLLVFMVDIAGMRHDDDEEEELAAGDRAERNGGAFPDLIPGGVNSQWRKHFIVHSRLTSPTKQMCYETHRAIILRLKTIGRIVSDYVTHLLRHSGALTAVLWGAAIRAVKHAGLWKLEVFERSYINKIVEQTFLQATSGHQGNDRYYVIPRASVPVPEDLKRQVLPHIWDMEVPEECIAEKQFLKCAKWFVEVFLQDCAIMRPQYPSFPLWDPDHHLCHKVFKPPIQNPEENPWEVFQATVNEPANRQEQPNNADVDTMDYLRREVLSKLSEIQGKIREFEQKDEQWKAKVEEWKAKVEDQLQRIEGNDNGRGNRNFQNGRRQDDEQGVNGGGNGNVQNDGHQDDEHGVNGGGNGNVQNDGHQDDEHGVNGGGNGNVQNDGHQDDEPGVQNATVRNPAPLQPPWNDIRAAQGYSMNRTITTVPQLWQEYVQGLSGYPPAHGRRGPALLSLESSYENEWRRGNRNQDKRFRNYQSIVEEVARLAAQLECTERESALHFQRYFNNHEN